MKILIICLTALLGFAPQLFAQSQINYSAPPGMRSVVNANGTPVANGNYVSIGTFDVGFNEGDVTANFDDPATLFANWNEFGHTNIATIALQPGRFTGQSINSDPFYGNKKIYIWIFSTDGATTPDWQDFDNVNEYGLYSSTLANWFFSGNPPPNNIETVNSGQVNQTFAGSLDPTRLYLWNFSIVPEPSTIGLLGLAVPAVVLALRRRRSK